MRRFLLVPAVVGLASISYGGTLAPLGVKDIGLMLRSGYSPEAVQREVAARHFMESVDGAAEKALRSAGASPVLLAALKSGVYAIPPEQGEAVQAELTAKDQRRVTQAEESRRLSAGRQTQLAQSRAATPGPAPVAAASTAEVANPIAPLVKGDLVTSKNGVLSTYLDQNFEKKKLIGLYFSAHWCGPCRKFTPQLVSFYNQNAAAHPEFEIVFVSFDRSANAMEGYMRDMQMPWPAVSFDKLPGNEALKKYAGDGIPCLVIVDANGRVISDSYAGKTYRGPAAVLADLEQFFTGRPAAPMTAQR